MPFFASLEKKLARAFEPPSYPEVVWFSRDVQQGLLRRWMIVVHSVRIMLIRRPDDAYDLVTDAVRDWTPQGEMEALARQGRISLNHYDRHVLMPIGTTILSSQAVSERFHAIQAAFPTHLSWTECQALLRQFGTAIVDHPAYEWQWFLDNTDTACQVLFSLPPPPAHLVAAHQTQQQNQFQSQSQAQTQDSFDSAIWASRNRMQMGIANQIQQQQIQTNQQIMQNNQNTPRYGS